LKTPNENNSNLDQTEIDKAILNLSLSLGKNDLVSEIIIEEIISILMNKKNSGKNTCN